ncbi:transcription termination factor MTERF8, chloroplastic-like [Phoenix dactylifera]|uniref:Transcription termination factor MTERF8, chloroplastic-like n=1 Tax=Phoenix dactylifera TaxID=42345 RepID=A0A8B8ZSC0_PHODC|nr:transcription termination factor MTERF8, chloroplastic-like [Phoenix dactylifera]
MLRLVHTRLVSHVTTPLRIPTTATAASPSRLLQLPFHHGLSHHISSSTPNDSSSLTVHFLKKSCGLSSEAALSAANKIHLKTTKNPRSVLTLLEHFGFSKPDITRIVTKRPQLLLASPDHTLKPKLDFYQSIGLSGADLARLLSGIPGLLLWSLAKRLLPNFNLLKTILHSNENVVLAVKKCPRLLTSDLPNVLLPKIESLRDYGMPASVIFTLLITHPKSLVKAADQFENTFNAIKGMGVSPSTSMFAHALGVFSRLPKSTMEKKLENYLSLGWSQEQLLGAFAKHPYCMTASDEKVRRNMEFFAEKLKWGPAYVSAYPVVLSLSFEKRIVPRCLVLEMLASKGLVKGDVKARHLMMGEKKFIENYVIKYEGEVPEIVDAMGGNKLGLGGWEKRSLGVDGYEHLDST